MSVALPSSRLFGETKPNDAVRPQFDLTLDAPTKLYDGEKCWCHPRAGIVPSAGKADQPRIVMTMNTIHVSGSDVFKAMFSLSTDDLGKHWTKPQEQSGLAIRHETIDGVERPVAVSDFWPTWHAASQTLLGTGHSVVYTPEWKIAKSRPRHTTYATYDPQQGAWTAWKKLEMPPDDKFLSSGAGCTQRVDLADGSILLPIYFSPPGKNAQVTIARCSFDGQTLQYVENGTEFAVSDKTRGLHEPSLTRLGDRYFLTIRNDKQGFVTRSDDGLHFEPLRDWKFDDGGDLGNYNTQQHWVTHSDGLFLVYTRRGANNDHVFRHRAPLLMAQVDPDRLCVIRETERILVPERGARLGNFGVTTVNEHETWVTVAEWMQDGSRTHIMPVNNKYGSDGSVFVARIHWDRPNKLA
ncbi:glycoside hydrolase [Blastopirellula sp. J2-11]|uniref:sialidase family protein n=1 Tax=Blastopirellula sp. J2-11 TaxID=2943192 RepID=UPI0021C93B83|nr:sialidase family protein [Blastopirellula sp. J2-11]UUO07242.1 glycoside hydrolase [Blastopirellula sp. J2-11]